MKKNNKTSLKTLENSNSLNLKIKILVISQQNKKSLGLFHKWNKAKNCLHLRNKENNKLLVINLMAKII